MRPATPLLIALRTRGLIVDGSGALALGGASNSSRFGPITPSVPALARVWQAPQLVTKRSLPPWRLDGTSSGEALWEPSWVMAQAGTPIPRSRTTSPNMTKVLRFICAAEHIRAARRVYSAALDPAGRGPARFLFARYQGHIRRRPHSPQRGFGRQTARPCWIRLMCSS